MRKNEMLTPEEIYGFKKEESEKEHKLGEALKIIHPDEIQGRKNVGKELKNNFSDLELPRMIHPEELENENTKPVKSEIKRSNYIDSLSPVSPKELGIPEGEKAVIDKQDAIEAIDNLFELPLKKILPELEDVEDAGEIANIKLKKISDIEKRFIASKFEKALDLNTAERRSEQSVSVQQTIKSLIITQMVDVMERLYDKTQVNKEVDILELKDTYLNTERIKSKIDFDKNIEEYFLILYGDKQKIREVLSNEEISKKIEELFFYSDNVGKFEKRAA